MKAVKKYYPLFLPPLLTLAVMLFVFKNYNMYPFGQGSIAWCDMNQQGIPLLMDFKDMLSGKDNLFFSMNNAGGMSFWGVFCFFLSNRQWYEFLGCVLLFPFKSVFSAVGFRAKGRNHIFCQYYGYPEADIMFLYDGNLFQML